MTSRAVSGRDCSSADGEGADSPAQVVHAFLAHCAGEESRCEDGSVEIGGGYGRRCEAEAVRCSCAGCGE